MKKKRKKKTGEKREVKIWEKKSGGGPPELSGAGSREWVSSLKGPSSTRKKNAPRIFVI